jgi:O-antigen/teichoic acid export membrane protein
MQQLKPLTLRHNFSWTFLGNGVYTACQWGMLVVMAKLGSPEMVGQFTLALSVTAPVVMFTNLQLSAIQSTDTKQEFDFEDYLVLRLMMSGLAILIVFGIALAAGYRLHIFLIIGVMILAKAIESISDVFYGLLQQHERMDRISISMIMRGSLAFLLLGTAIYLTHNVLWGVVGLTIAWALVLFSYDIRSRKLIQGNSKRIGVRLKWQIDHQKKLFNLSLPLGVVMMLSSLNNNIPRYVIEHYWSERELGIFAATAYLMVATSMFVGAMGQSVGPRLAKYYAVGNNMAFRTILIKMIGIVLLINGLGMVVVLVAGREILTVFYSPEYAKHSDLLVWFMVATCISHVGSLLGNGMSAVRYFQAQLPVFATVTVISAIASLSLIPRLGMQGAVITLIIAAIAQVFLSLGVLYHALNNSPLPLEVSGKT